MKRILSLFLALAICLLCGCGAVPPAPQDGGLRIVCTVFPIYDWLRQLTTGVPNVELTFLMGSGVDIHSFQPSAADLVRVSSCDMLVYVGGESDLWIGDALREAVNPDLNAINLMTLLGSGVKEEELVEGMQGEDEPREEPEYDEHVWLSLKNAGIVCTAVSEQLQTMDPDNADAYAANAKTYLTALSKLDGQYARVADDASFDTLVFGDRFPFRYLLDDYGLHYYAAFVGCSAETEASFETIAFLASKVDTLGLGCILTIEGSDHRIAQTIAANTVSGDKGILTMDSMQSTTAADADAGASYLSIMQGNLDVLRQALN